MEEEDLKQSSSKDKHSLPSDSVTCKIRRLVIENISILQWFPKYEKEDAICDIIAGITIGLTMLPQSIAYAHLAGLSPQYGLYSSFMGPMIYVILGTVKEITVGPSSLMALLTFAFTQDLPIDFVVLLTFFTGCISLLFGILRLGMLVDFISAPVVSAFTSASAIIIAQAQMKGLLGINYKSVGFVDNTWKLISNINQTKLGDATLGIASVIFLLTFMKLKDIPIGEQNEMCVLPENNKLNGSHENDIKEKNKVLKTALWYLSLSRNALVVLIAALSSYVFERYWGKTPYILSGQIQPGLPAFHLPSFSTTFKNETFNFVDMAMELRSGILIVPVVAILVNVAIAKAYSTGGKLYATKEMITLGLCNIAGSFISSMPTSGAFTRSAVSTASGVRTPLAGLYTGILIILALQFLTPYFYYIPRATLAAVLICAVAFMVDLNIFKTLWKTCRRDFAAALVTLVSCLVISIEMGLLLGVSINCLFLLYLWARPEVKVECKNAASDHEYILVTPDVGLFFPSIDLIRAELCRIGNDLGCGRIPIVLNCSHFKGIDFSAAKGITEALNEFSSRQQQLVLLNFQKDALKLLKKYSVKQFISCSNEDELMDVLFGENGFRGKITKAATESPEEETTSLLLENSVPKNDILVNKV